MLEAEFVGARWAPTSRHAGPWRQALRRLRGRPIGLIALTVVVAFYVVAALAGLLAPYSAGRLFIELINQPRAPSLDGGHLLGTDQLGHDALTQLLYAIRQTAELSAVCAAGATALGVLIGYIAPLVRRHRSEEKQRNS